MINRSFTRPEIKNTVKSFEDNKAVGRDGIPYEFHKYHMDSMVPSLQILYESLRNDITNGQGENHLEKTFLVRIIKLIPKTRKDQHLQKIGGQLHF